MELESTAEFLVCLEMDSFVIEDPIRTSEGYLAAAFLVFYETIFCFVIFYLSLYISFVSYDNFPETFLAICRVKLRAMLWAVLSRTFKTVREASKTEVECRTRAKSTVVVRYRRLFLRKVYKL